MNVLLADHAHRVIKIPASSIKSIIGVEHESLAEDRQGCRAIIRYNYGAGPMFAWLRTSADQIMAQSMKAMPAPWLPLKTAKGDDVFLLAHTIVATHGLDAAECGGANTRVDFDAFGDGTEIKFATVVDTDDEIEATKAVVEQSINEAIAPAPTVPARKPRRKVR